MRLSSNSRQWLAIKPSSVHVCTCRRQLHQTTRLRPSLSAPTTVPRRHEQIRPLFNIFKGKGEKPPEASFPYYDPMKNPKRSDPTPAPSRPVLAQNNLFHPLSKSPIPSMRAMGERIAQKAVCPHGVRHDVGKHHVTFECPDCGIPVYCSEDHWEKDYHNHVLVCDTLREVNEDEHDLRSGRAFPEFEYPTTHMVEEAVINFTNWDTFLFTRQFEAINDERSLRHATRLLTYPATIGSVLHELSPYDLKNGRLTPEGLKSFSASRYTLHPAPSGSGMSVSELKLTPPPMRFFILGARAEASLPRDVWAQLAYMFPRSSFHIIFIGPEAFMGRPSSLPWPPPPKSPENPFGQLTERLTSTMKVSTYQEYYHTLHKTGHFRPYDPYFDTFVMFHPGLGHPGSMGDWEATLPQLLETKCPIIVTGFTEEDMNRDVKWVEETCKGEFDMLLNPEENTFKSLKWDIDEADPSGELSQGNWGVWAFRGKRYETQKAPDLPNVINL